MEFLPTFENRSYLKFTTDKPECPLPLIVHQIKHGSNSWETDVWGPTIEKRYACPTVSQLASFRPSCNTEYEGRHYYIQKFYIEGKETYENKNSISFF